MQESYAVVIVTYNRIDCLKIALEKYENQTVQPQALIVVDNCSNDGTKDYLDSWKKKPLGHTEKIVIHTNKNLGGAGGFYTGLREAQKKDVYWIWVADDDAYPEDNAIEILLNEYRNMPDRNNISALFSAVVNNNKFDLSHRRVTRRDIRGIHFVPVSEDNYSQKRFYVSQGSYVGMFVRKNYLNKTGLTRKEFFIYYDDTEHTTRLGKEGKMYCVTGSRVIHNVTADNSFGWKNYYGFRNAIILIREQYGMYFAILESLKRYILFVAPWNRKYSKNIRKMLKEGLKDGLKRKEGLHPIYKPGWKD